MAAEELGLLAPPEIGGGGGKCDANARLALDALPNVDDAAFQFSLRAHVGEKEPLAAHDHVFERQQASFVVGVESFGFLVEGLLIDVRAVDEQRCAVRVAKIAAPIGLFDVVPA